MWAIGNEGSWYAIFVVVGQEEKVKRKLQDKFNDELEFFVPKRKLMERKNGQLYEIERTLFPGYVLVKGKITVKNYYDMKGIWGIIKLLRGNDEPLRIRNEEVIWLVRLMGEKSEKIGFSKILKEGDQIRVSEGPLIGLEGMIIKIDKRKGRAKIRMDFLGDERLIELGVEMVV